MQKQINYYISHNVSDSFHYLSKTNTTTIQTTFMRLSAYRKIPMLFQTLTQDISELEANLCYAFVDPTRILILYALNDQPCTVNGLTKKLGSTQSKISRHLKVLRDHGMVHTTRQGVSITYKLADNRLIDALDILHDVLRDDLAFKANLVTEAK